MILVQRRRSEHKWWKYILKSSASSGSGFAVLQVAYFSHLIRHNKHIPGFLFDTVAKLSMKQPSLNRSVKWVVGLNEFIKPCMCSIIHVVLPLRFCKLIENHCVSPTLCLFPQEHERHPCCPLFSLRALCALVHHQSQPPPRLSLPLYLYVVITLRESNKR